MIYTFTLTVNEEHTGDHLYSEYHNFKELDDSYLYYRGGSNHPLEIILTKENALIAMDNLIKSGWTCDKPKVITINHY